LLRGTGSAGSRTATISQFVISGVPHEKTEVIWFQVAVEASVTQPDTYRVRAAGERGLTVSPKSLAPDSSITDQAVVMVPESFSPFDKTRVSVERESRLLGSENLDFLQVG
jgi:hypothetical protein